MLITVTNARPLSISEVVELSYHVGFEFLTLVNVRCVPRGCNIV
jgi:hypothetical protein